MPLLSAIEPHPGADYAVAGRGAANDAALRDRHAFIFVTASRWLAEEDCGDTLAELKAPIIPKPFHIDAVLDAVADAAQRMAAK